ncbi:MAG: reverse transcriptase family protein [Parvularculaceae bacterium]|nr:reverse transcriptase family protein [Parvularculaceae bacterium]
MTARAAQYLGKRAPRSLQRLIEHVIASARTPYPPSSEHVARALLNSTYFDAAARAVLQADSPPKAVLHSPAFAPARAFAGLPIPRIETAGELAAWFKLSVDELDWLADTRRGHGRASQAQLQHYSYALAAKRVGAPRLIESPKPRLKAAQRRILHEILDHAPSHSNAHGFVRGRSCISGAQIHAGEPVVLRLDLQRFFTGIRASRVHGLFRALGYPSETARLLTGLCTTCTPQIATAAIEDWRIRQEYGAPHLPQGAPTSPSLANLCAWRLDQRLGGLARRLAINYSRYADDLCFSGDRALAARAPSFVSLVETIASEEGFVVNSDKTKVMRASSSQRVTGVVVNQHVNAQRHDYDALKATLHNCRTSGDPETQNRKGLPDFRAHLEGRINWVEQLNPHRGMKLRLMFDAIHWPAGARDAGDRRADASRRPPLPFAGEAD